MFFNYFFFDSSWFIGGLLLFRLNSSREEALKSWESYLAWGKTPKLTLEELEFAGYGELWEEKVGFGSVINCGDEVKVCLFWWWWELKLILSLFWL